MQVSGYADSTDVHFETCIKCNERILNSKNCTIQRGIIFIVGKNLWVNGRLAYFFKRTNFDFVFIFLSDYGI